MPLLLFHVLLLAVSSAAAYGGGEGTAGQTYHNDSPSMCHKFLPCGGQHVDIHYPFFLATNATPPIEDDNDDDGHRPAARSYCGYPGMAVTCDGACAILRLGGHDYTILDISYENHTVMLADRDEVLNGGDCPRVTHNVTVPLETRLSLSATANDGELLFFYNCIFTAPPPPGIPPINCSGFPARGRRGASYVALESDVRRRDEWARACETVVVVPVLRNWLPGPEYHPPQLNGEGYGKMLKRGFQLSWEPSTGPCYVCEQTKGKCSYNQSGEFVGCMCSDGNLRSSDCDEEQSICASEHAGTREPAGIYYLCRIYNGDYNRDRLTYRLVKQTIDGSSQNSKSIPFQSVPATLLAQENKQGYTIFASP